MFLFSCSSEKPRIIEIPEQSEKRSLDSKTTGEVLKETVVSPHMEGVVRGEEAEGAPVNNPPAVERAKLQLETLDNTDVLKVIALGIDSDGDEVTMGYEWERNGEALGKGDTMKGFKRGDIVSVKITPFDGKGYGRSKTLTTEIKNCPPQIVEHREIQFDGQSYSCQIRATDPDGDPLTYSLKSAPPGMTIDPSTGIIQWSVPPDFEGETSITVSVTDGHGGESSQDLAVEITPASKK